MKIRNYGLFLAVGMLFLTLGITPAEAAKKRVWGKTIVAAPARTSQLSVTAKFTSWKQYLNVSFKGVANTKGITYELIYTSNGIDQGAMGRVEVSEGNVTRSLFLGTCSHRVCTAHKNVSNVRLSVTYQLANGQSVTKNYKVKY